MTFRHGRRVAILTTVGAMLTLGAGAYACRGRIQEEYWIWRLEKGGDSERLSAAQRLGRMHSVAAIPGIITVIRSEDIRKSLRRRDLRPDDFYCLSHALNEIGQPAIPFVIQM